MKNPLKLFHNLLFNSNALNPSTMISEGDERLSLFDEDITERIKKETGKAFIAIDEEYWNGGKSENEYFFSKLLNISSKLIEVSCKQLEVHLERIVMPKDMSNWLMVYNNTQCVYENLLIIHNHIIEYYSGEIEVRSEEISIKKYPFLFIEYAVKLREKCLSNIGKVDTEFSIKLWEQDFTIKVETIKLSPLSAVLPVEKVLKCHADYIDTLDKKSSNNLLEWNGTPKDFVSYFFPMINGKKLAINGRQDRAPIVNALHEAFNIRVIDKTSKQEKRISLETLQSYFKKEASGEVY